jgi:hypothetical protein
MPAIRGAPYTYTTFVGSTVAPGSYQANPTLEPGDVKVSLDGGPLSNISVLPVVNPVGSALIEVSLSADEMSHDNVAVVFHDQAGNEWLDSYSLIQPETIPSNLGITQRLPGVNA